MAKVLKIIVVVLLGLAVLVALAITILPKALPLSSMLAGTLEENLGRKATVEDVSAGLWGGLEVTVRGLVVQDKPKYGKRPLVKLGSLHLEASFWPLITGRLVVDRIAVDGLQLSLVRAKNGRLNWQDIPAKAGGPGGGEMAEHAEAPEEGGLIVRKLAVTGSSLFLFNQANGKRSELPLERCELSSDLSLDQASGQLELAMPGVSLSSEFKSRGYGEDFKLDQGRLNLKIDLVQLAARLAPLAPSLKATGSIRVTGLASGDASALSVQTQAQAKDLQVQTKAMPRPFRVGDASWAAQATANLNAQTVDIKQAQLLIPQAGMVHTLRGVLGWGKALGKSDAVYDQQTDLAKLARFMEPLLPWPLKARGQASKQVRFKGAGPGTLEMSGQGLVRNALVESPAWPAPWKEPEMLADFKLLVKDEGHELVIQQMDWTSTPAKLSLTGTLRADDHQAKLRLKVDGEYLDLDRLPLRPPESKGAKPHAPKAKAAKAEAQAPAAQKAAKARAARVAETRQSLKGLDAELQIKLDRLTMQGYEMKNLRAALQVKDQKAEIKDFQSGFLGGSIQTKAGVDFKPAAPAGEMTAQAKDIEITPSVFRKLKNDFPLFALPLSSLEGVFDLDSQMAWQGLEPEAVLASLKGKGSLKAQDGVTIGMDFLDDVESVAKMFAKDLDSLPRRFDQFQGDYTMGQGKINYEIALKAANDEMEAQIIGTTGLLDDSLDAKIKFKADTVGRTLREFLDKDGTFPIGLGGTIHKPVPKLDVTGNLIPAAENLLKNLLNRE
ncbi:MAG: AsmA family protein [Deltaproteobacteria bacterium]|nr:AsmA family protein [Deltaproteobacteria bacterium]